MPIEMPVFKPCPWCNRQPRVQVDEVKKHGRPDAWAWVHCTCVMSPHHGRACSTGYHEHAQPYKFVTTRTDEEAMQEAVRRVAYDWNERTE